MLVWQNYRTDLGRSYPLYALGVSQVNNVESNINPVDLLPLNITNDLRKFKHSCSVEGLTPRVLILWATDGAQFRVSYPIPFSDDLANYLVANLQVQAFEFVGERIKDGRLRRMLENV